MQASSKDIFALPHFKEYLFVILKRRKIIIISIILMILFGIINSQKGRPVYVASVKIMIETGEEVKPVSRAAGWNVYGSPMGYKGGTERYENEYELMRSSIVAKKTTELLGWTDRKNAIGYLRGSVEINPMIKGYQVTNVAFITARSMVPKEAMDMANYTAKSYIKSKEDEASEKIKNVYNMFGKQLDAIKEKLRQAETALNEFKESHNIVGFEDVNLDEKATQRLAEEMIKTRTDMQKITALTDSLKNLETEESLFSAYGVVANNYPEAIDQSLYKQIEREKKEYFELLAVYTERHPLVTQKAAQIESLELRLKEDLQNVILDLKTTYSMLRAKEESIMYTLKLKTPEMGEAKSEYYTLKREVDNNRELYNHLTASMKELNVYEEISKMADVRILEWAKLPKFPEKKGNIALFFAPILGLFMGISLAFFMEYMDNTIKTQGDVKQYLDLPVIGVIPHISPEDVVK